VRYLHDHAAADLAIVAMPVNDVGYEAPLHTLARKVLGRGCPWILLNRAVEAHVDQMRAEFPGGAIALVSVDHREAGRIQGRQVAARLGGRPGTVLCVLGNMMTTAARARRDGLAESLPRSSALPEVEGLWSAESAEKVTARWLAATAPPALDAVAAQNDPMAIGARKALARMAAESRRPEWAKVPVFGIDGVPEEGQRLVDERVLAGTVVLPPSSGPAVELFAAAFPPARAAVPPRVMLAPRPYPA
jgi:ABC-type sugar transport system substrate-binding protein